jgi:alpha-1,3-glucan synthase
MFFLSVLVFFGLSAELVECLRYAPEYAEWNLNTNQEAILPLDYSGSWENHTYHPSPSNWRFPVYTLFLDRYVNGDPQNDNANETLFEQDITSTQFRHGGDMQGLIDSLDYIQGFGIKVRGSTYLLTVRDR